MSATKKEVLILSDLLPSIISPSYDKYTFLSAFVMDTRKKYGPNFNIYFKDNKNNLYVHYVELMKKEFINGCITPETVANSFSYRNEKLYKLKAIEKALIAQDYYHFHRFDLFDSKIHYFLLSYHENKDQFKFIADFFDIPLVLKSEFLSEKSGKKKLKCVNCGRCCSYYFKVEVTKNDINRWKRLNRDDILEKVNSIGKNPYLYLRNGKSHCSFLKNNKCVIHKIKPDICRAWPPSIVDRSTVKCKALINACTKNINGEN